MINTIEMIKHENQASVILINSESFFVFFAFVL